MGQGADANVGQKEPLLSIKESRERKGGVTEEDGDERLPRLKDRACSLSTAVPEDRGYQITRRGGEVALGFDEET